MGPSMNLILISGSKLRLLISMRFKNLQPIVRRSYRKVSIVEMMKLETSLRSLNMQFIHSLLTTSRDFSEILTPIFLENSISASRRMRTERTETGEIWKKVRLETYGPNARIRWRLLSMNSSISNFTRLL